MNNTPIWLPLLAALLGALIGGMLTLMAGVLNDRRTARSARADLVRSLGAELLTVATDIRGAMNDLHRAWAHRRRRPATLPTEVRDAETRLARAQIEFRWLVRRCSLEDRAGWLYSALRELIYDWPDDRSHHAEREALVEQRYHELRVELQTFAELPPRHASSYLKGRRSSAASASPPR